MSCPSYQVGCNPVILSSVSISEINRGIALLEPKNLQVAEGAEAGPGIWLKFASKLSFGHNFQVKAGGIVPLLSLL